MIDLLFCEKLIEQGYSLTPLKGKVPYVKEWQNKLIPFLDFQNHYSNADNIGLVCGVNDVEVVDIDLKVLPSLSEQKTFWNNYIGFLKDNIDDFNKKFVVVKTKNSGYHIIYRCKTIEGNKKLATLMGHKSAIIETRGKGGQVVIYDDNVVSDINYHDIQLITEEDRNILMLCSTSFNSDIQKNIEIIPQEITNKNYKEGDVKPGEDFNSRHTVFEIVSNDFEVVNKIDNQIILKRIGSDNPTCGSIFTNSNILYIFTHNTPYPSEKALTPFSCYAYKNCNGDYKEAARRLYKEGYGTRLIHKAPTLIEPIEEIEYKELEFPIEIFPIEIQNYIIQCKNTLNSSVDYMGSTLVWLLSVIVGNSFKIKVKNGWVEGGILWIIIVGKQGIGKTPSINNIIRPLNKANIEEIKKYRKLEQQYEAYNDLSNDDKKKAVEVQKPIKKQFIVNDITLEALIDYHEASKNAIGIFRDEIAGWIKDMNKYRAGSDVEHWLSSWSNQGIYLTRKTAKSSGVNSPFMPVLGGVQPNIFSQFYTEENKESGFIDRMLISFPELYVDRYSEKELEQDVITWYDDYIINMYNVFKGLIKYANDDIDSYICEFDNEAKKEWERIFNNITDMQNSDMENEYMKSMFPKQKTYIPRFTLLLHLLKQYNNGTEIDLAIGKESVLDAEKLSNYFISMSKKIKVDTIKKNEIKNIIYTNQKKNKKDLCLEILKVNPNTSKNELADILGVSRQMIHSYLK